MQPKVSIIMAVYNADQYLGAALDCLVNQTEPNIEIICVDDGSTDSSAAILEDYAARDKRFTILKQKNQYAGVARNNGLRHATGEYLLFLDADDLFAPTLVEDTYNKAKEQAADVVCYRYHQFIGTTADYRAADWAFRKDLFPQKACFNCHDCPDTIFQLFERNASSKLFKRAFIEQQDLWFMATRNNNDAFFACAALVIAERVATLDKVLLYYRRDNPGSLTRTKTADPLTAFKAYEKIKEYLVDKGLYTELKKSFLLLTEKLYLRDVLPEVWDIKLQYLQNGGFAKVDFDEALQKDFLLKVERKLAQLRLRALRESFGAAYGEGNFDSTALYATIPWGLQEFLEKNHQSYVIRFLYLQQWLQGQQLDKDLENFSQIYVRFLAYLVLQRVAADVELSEFTQLRLLGKAKALLEEARELYGAGNDVVRHLHSALAEGEKGLFAALLVEDYSLKKQKIKLEQAKDNLARTKQKLAEVKGNAAVTKNKLSEVKESLALTKRELAQSQKREQGLKNSLSYRLGRALTFLPRALKKLFP